MVRRLCPPLFVRLALLLAVLTVADGMRESRLSRAQEPEYVPALLTGVLYPAEEAAWINGLLPVAVMIDNYIDGRPQYGMDGADLVYELLVEGGITRFMAVYQSQEVEWIEPVRSARTPFLYLARELDAVLGHVGAAGTAGPADTQTQFGRWGVLHLDEQFNPGPFWRDRSRYAPHNTVTSTVELRGHASGLGWVGPSAAEPWLFKEDFEVANALGGAIGSFSYAFAWSGGPPGYAFAADWYYDADSNSYLRSQAGHWHVDGSSGRRLSARNVVIQYDSAATVDGEGHVLYGSLGEGPAYVFLDGQIIEAVWSKRWREDRTRYWDLNGAEIHFNRGNTWIAVLPYDSPLTWE